MSDDGLLLVLAIGAVGYLIISGQANKAKQNQQTQYNWFTDQSGCTPTGSSWRDMLDLINGGAANNACTSGGSTFTPGGATLPPAGGASGAW